MDAGRTRGRAPAGARARLTALLVAAVPLAGAATFAFDSGRPASVVPAFAGEVLAPQGATPALPFAVSVLAPPARLSETGLYRADGSIDPRNRPFEPQYPLWTDGATKRRWVHLPPGTKIDVSDLDAWRFPPGTTFWKEFAWEGRRVETRMIRRTDAGEWMLATYVWNDAQTDAVLAPGEGVPGAFALPASAGAGNRHSIPGRADCMTCHASSPAGVLGFTALQLSDDRDPLAPHAVKLPASREGTGGSGDPGVVTLRTLVREDRLVPARPELATAPPRIRTADPVERAALGYLSANCGGCHNARGPLARLGFSLLHDASAPAGSPEPGRVTTVGARGRFVVPGVAADSSRIVAPGVPGWSALLYRMSSRRAASQMPPLGSGVVDEEAVRLVGRWIAGPDARAVPESRLSARFPAAGHE